MSSLVRRRWFAVAAALLIGIGTTGVALASGVLQSVDSPNALVVCANNTTGQLRAVADASQCTRKEHAVVLEQAVAGGQTSFSVDCNDPAQSIGAVLETVALGTEPVTVDVTGVCAESLGVTRDSVTLNFAPGSGLGTNHSLVVDGARRVNIDGLTITGGGSLEVFNGASAWASGLHVTGSQNAAVSIGGGSSLALGGAVLEVNQRGVEVADDSRLQIWGGRIADNTDRGLDCGSGHVRMSDEVVSGNGGNHAIVGEWAGCTIEIENSTIQNNAGNGVIAFGSSSVILHGSVVEGTQNNGGAGAQDGGTLGIYSSTVRQNAGPGVFGYSGGHVDIQRSTIEENNSDGITLFGGSSGRFESHTIVRNNGQNGVGLQDTSVGTFDDDNEIVGNGGWGISCSGPPSVAMIHIDETGLAGVTGNTVGQNNCPLA